MYESIIWFLAGEWARPGETVIPTRAYCTLPSEARYPMDCNVVRTTGGANLGDTATMNLMRNNYKPE